MPTEPTALSAPVPGTRARPVSPVVGLVVLLGGGVGAEQRTVLA
ncbi:hypothetical protein ABZ260_39400 [Streptosporangium sp. NPDC006013]